MNDSSKRGERNRECLMFKIVINHTIAEFIIKSLFSKLTQNWEKPLNPIDIYDLEQKMRDIDEDIYYFKRQKDLYRGYRHTDFKSMSRYDKIIDELENTKKLYRYIKVSDLDKKAP